jgi:hypothetical protein
VSIEKDIACWLLNGKTGISSKAMAAVVIGCELEPMWRCDNHPHDLGDFNRCIKFVDTVPEVRNWFPAIRMLSPQWEAVIGNWDRLRTSFIEEAGYDWSKSHRCPETYKLWKSLGL